MIKVCPFCGTMPIIKEFKKSKTEIIGVLTDKSINHPLPSQFLVKCNNSNCNGCQPQTKFFDTEEAAIYAWNQRFDEV